MSLIIDTLDRLRCRRDSSDYKAQKLRKVMLRFPWTIGVGYHADKLRDALSILVAEETGVILQLQLLGSVQSRDTSQGRAPDPQAVERLLVAIGRGRKWSRGYLLRGSRTEVFAVLGDQDEAMSALSARTLLHMPPKLHLGTKTSDWERLLMRAYGGATYSQGVRGRSRWDDWDKMMRTNAIRPLR